MNLIKITNFISLLLLAMLFGCGGGGSGSSSVPDASSGVDGKGGSMARFSLIGDYLYTISGQNLQLYSLTQDPATPYKFSTVPISWDIETLYSANDYLFIGASNGVYIFDNSDPTNPVKVSQFLHVASCDPVVVSGNYAYVTLSAGSGRCRQGVNRLDVLDLTDIKNPSLLKSYSMQNPKGLGIQDGLLFVCDGDAGLKVYNLADPINPQFEYTDNNINCYDLIPFKNNGIARNNINGNLVISDASGVVQYQYTVDGFTEVSKILQGVSTVAK